MGDQRELFGQVASVPTAWRALKEAAAGGDRARRKVTAAVNKARRHAWAQAGPLPPVRTADRVLEGTACIRLDATVVQAHGDKEPAEANFKGYGHHPLLAACDNTGEPLAWMLRPGSAGSNTAAGHLRLLREAIEALPPARPAVAADEHTVATGPLLHVGLEDRQHMRRNRDSALTGVGLGRRIERDGGFEQFHAVFVDSDRCGGKVNVFRLERDDLTATHAAPRAEQDGGPVPGSYRRDERGHLGDGGNRAFFSPIRARTGNVAGIRPYGTVAERAIHDRAKESVRLLN